MANQSAINTQKEKVKESKLTAAQTQKKEESQTQ